MNHALVELRVDPNRGMGDRGCRPADQQWNVELLPFHLACHGDHFIKRRRYQTAQSYGVGLMLSRGIENLLEGHHYA